MYAVTIRLLLICILVRALGSLSARRNRQS